MPPGYSAVGGRYRFGRSTSPPLSVGATGIEAGPEFPCEDDDRMPCDGAPCCGCELFLCTALRNSGCSGIEVVGGAMPGISESSPVGGPTTDAPNTKDATMMVTYMTSTSSPVNQRKHHFTNNVALCLLRILHLESSGININVEDHSLLPEWRIGHLDRIRDQLTRIPSVVDCNRDPRFGSRGPSRSLARRCPAGARWGR